MEINRILKVEEEEDKELLSEENTKIINQARTDYENGIFFTDE